MVATITALPSAPRKPPRYRARRLYFRRNVVFGRFNSIAFMDDPLGARVSINQRFLFFMKALEMERSSFRKGVIYTVDT